MSPIENEKIFGISEESFSAIFLKTDFHTIKWFVAIWEMTYWESQSNTVNLLQPSVPTSTIVLAYL